MFADDTKLYNDPTVAHDVLQTDLIKINNWCETWLLTLNIDKCHVLHLGHNNPKINYMLGANTIQSVVTERDLGVVVSNDFKWTNHISAIVKKANSKIFLIKKAFLLPLSVPLFLALYKTYVRPLLEFATPAWNPYYARDIDLLERVQRRATKMVAGLKHLGYYERLSMLNLQTLRQRRQFFDLVEVYKIMHGKYRCPLHEMFVMNTNGHLRGHSLKLYRARFRKLIRQHFFSLRVVNDWNALDPHVVTTGTVATFRRLLYSNRIAEYDPSLF
jgi:hypothetical protein